MAFTQAQLDKLNEAIAEGALRVKYQDKEVEYRSMDEMLKVRALMMRELGLRSTEGQRIYLKHSKGTE